MSLFSGIDNAKFGDKSPDLTPGCKYLVEILSTKAFVSRAKTPLAITEFKVLESSGPNANVPGTTAKQMINLGVDAAGGNIKNQVAAILGVPESAKETPFGSWDKAAEEIFESGKNPAKGVRVNVEVVNISKKDGDFFPLHKYTAETSSATPAPSAAVVSATTPPATGKTATSKK